MENRESCKEEYMHRIHCVQDYIEKNIDEPLELDELADAAGFSKYHFSRIFSAITGESLAHYVLRLKLERSLFFLAHRPDLSITDIGYMAGYSDTAVYSRAFKNYFMVSPREYRNEYSKNCKEIALLSDYNGPQKDREKDPYRFPVTTPIKLVSLKERRILYVRHDGNYESLAAEFGRLADFLYNEAAKYGIKGTQFELLTMYHDNPEFTDAGKFRTSLGVELPSHIKVDEAGNVGVMTLQAANYAVGSFDITAKEFPDAWNFMYREWLTGSGYVPANDMPYERYKGMPDPVTGKMNVEIYVPVEPFSF